MNKNTRDMLALPAPYDAQAEDAVLGSVILLASVLDEIGGVVRPADFFSEAHGRTFAGLQAIHEAGRRTDDPVTTLPALRDCGATIDAAEFYRLVKFVPHAGDARYYAERVREFADKRRLIELGAKLTEQGYTRDPIQPALTDAETAIAAIRGNAGRKGVTIGDAAKSVIDAIESPAEKIHGRPLFWSLPKIDELFGPLMPGEVAIIAARPGCGKTALGVQVAMHAANGGRRVAFFSLEMTADELASRVMCSGGDVDSRKVRRGELSESELTRLAIQADRLSQTPIVIFDAPGEPISRIRGIARYEKKARGLDAVIVDYLGLVGSEKGDGRLERHETVRRISSGLKSMAKEIGVPVVCLCQLNREADGAEPKLSNLRESGAIEQDADMVLFIHHAANETHLIGAKHRHGAVGKVRLKFEPAKTRFVEPDFPTPTAKRDNAIDQYNGGNDEWN